MYHSQIGQDKFIREKFFPTKTNGFFLDIGAFDGVTFSNSLHFETFGWKGVCIEPSPDEFQKLRLARQCDCEHACVWNKSGVVDFVTVDCPHNEEARMLAGIESVMDPAHKQRIIKEMGKGVTNIIKVPSITLNEVFEKYQIKDVDYCSIDTEGSELEILKAFDFNSHFINVFSIENNNGNPELRSFMSKKGYTLKKIYWDDIYYRS